MSGEANVEKLLLTPADAAVALSVSRTTVYELMNRGLLRSVKLGTCRRIPVEAIRELIGQLSMEASGHASVTSRDYISFQRRKESHG
jgi:excisionase family DNA binding protein